MSRESQAFVVLRQWTDVLTEKEEPLESASIVGGKIPGYNPDDYESKQVSDRSKDGTPIPMFPVYKKGLKLDGKNPAWMTGYGGFNISTSPSFSPLRLVLLENGFVFASVKMNGGLLVGAVVNSICLYFFQSRLTPKASPTKFVRHD